MGTEDSLSQGSAGPRVCFVIPTYNEADNITLLLQRLSELYRDPNMMFLVVDDESPDGTGRLVREFAAGNDRVHLLEGKKRGLGAAYVRGITHAMDRLEADVVIQMDADFSHDPADAGRLVARVTADADVAIGSRYVPGGSVDESWGFRRRQLSVVGQPPGALDRRPETGARLHRRHQGDPDHLAASRQGGRNQRARLRLPGGAAAPPVAAPPLPRKSNPDHAPERQRRGRQQPHHGGGQGVTP